MDRYRVLNYPGDLVSEALAGVIVQTPDGRPPRRVPLVLGHDEAYRPYEVLDAEPVYELTADAVTELKAVATRVHLQPAEPDTIRGARAAAIAARTEAAARARADAAVRHFWRPDLWPRPLTVDEAAEAAA